VFGREIAMLVTKQYNTLQLENTEETSVLSTVYLQCRVKVELRL